MKNKIFDIITNYFVNEGINKILLEDEEYAGVIRQAAPQMLDVMPCRTPAIITSSARDSSFQSS